MAFAKAIFSSVDIAEIVAADKKRYLAEKQKLLQDWGVDALMERVLDPWSHHDDKIKEQLMAGNRFVVVWTGFQAYFKRHSTEPNKDCRSEQYENTDDTVEERAIRYGVHDPVELYNRGTQSIYAILKHTDFLSLLAARFGTHFTCSSSMEECPSEPGRPATKYWMPQKHSIFICFWPNGVPQDLAKKKEAAVAAWEHRQKNLVVEHCQICDKSLMLGDLKKTRFPAPTPEGWKPQHVFLCSRACQMTWNSEGAQ